MRTYMFSRNVPFGRAFFRSGHDHQEQYAYLVSEYYGKDKAVHSFITHDIDEAILLSDRICLLTGKPGEITKEIVIRNRNPGEKILILQRSS